MEHIVVPDIYCPFPSLISPHLAQVHEHALDWVKRFRLIQEEAGLHYYRAINLSEFICRLYPKTSLEELLVLNDEGKEEHSPAVKRFAILVPDHGRR